MRVSDRLRRLSTLLALAAGLALGVGLLLHVGWQRVFELIVQAHWWIAGVLVVHFAQLALTAAAWRTVARPGVPSFTIFLMARWLREGVNSLLPVLPVAGPLAAIRVLMRHGLGLPRAVAATLADSTVEIITQIPFTLFGLALLVLIEGRQAVSVWMLVGLAVLCGLAAALVPAQRLGLARLAERGAQRLGWAGRIDGLDQALIAIQRHRRRLAVAALRHLAAWLLGGLEVWCALAALGHPVDATASLVIESLSLAIRGAGFLIPGALGVQEGGLILVCGLLGVPPALGLALSLVKRLRDIVFGVPSLAMWVGMERRGGVIPGGPLPWPQSG